MYQSIITYLVKAFKITAIVIITIVAIRTFVVEPGRVNGRSMETTFIDEDVFLVSKFLFLIFPPQRGQIVQYYDPVRKNLIIKRVIGLPGEQVVIRQNSVFVIDKDGKTFELNEPYLNDNTITKSVSGAAKSYATLPEHEYFLLGDNRENSYDSRYVGPIHRSFISGLVLNIPFIN